MRRFDLAVRLFIFGILCVIYYGLPIAAMLGLIR